MTDRPCNECIWMSADGCTSWDCEPVTRREARERLKVKKCRECYCYDVNEQRCMLWNADFGPDAFCSYWRDTPWIS